MRAPTCGRKAEGSDRVGILTDPVAIVFSGRCKALLGATAISALLVLGGCGGGGNNNNNSSPPPRPLQSLY